VDVLWVRENANCCGQSIAADSQVLVLENDGSVHLITTSFLAGCAIGLRFPLNTLGPFNIFGRFV
jgi:hypothetical protein